MQEPANGSLGTQAQLDGWGGGGGWGVHGIILSLLEITRYGHNQSIVNILYPLSGYIFKASISLSSNSPPRHHLKLAPHSSHETSREKEIKPNKASGLFEICHEICTLYNDIVIHTLMVNGEESVP